jgi:hypothetical protein
MGAYLSREHSTPLGGHLTGDRHLGRNGRQKRPPARMAPRLQFRDHAAVRWVRRIATRPVHQQSDRPAKKSPLFSAGTAIESQHDKAPRRKKRHRPRKSASARPPAHHSGPAAAVQTLGGNTDRRHHRQRRLVHRIPFRDHTTPELVPHH